MASRSQLGEAFCAKTFKIPGKKSWPFRSFNAVLVCRTASSRKTEHPARDQPLVAREELSA
jgi:hypothetical protein